MKRLFLAWLILLVVIGACSLASSAPDLSNTSAPGKNSTATAIPIPTRTPYPTSTSFPTPIPTFTPIPDLSPLLQALSPVLSGQGVPQAAEYHPDQPGPHPVVILSSDGTGGYGWNMNLPSGWSPASVQQTELVAIVSEERKISLGSQAYNIGPDITAYRFENDLELREARTGDLLSTFTFIGSDPPPFPYQASYITTTIEGTHLFAQDIEDWMCDLVMSAGCIQQVATLNESGSAINAIAFSPDGKILASGHEDAAVRLWQVSDGELVGTLYGHTASLLSLAFSPDGQTLATGSNDQTVRTWRTSDWGLERSLDTQCFVIGVAFSPDGQTLVAGCSWNAVKLFRVSDGSLVPGWETVAGSSFAFSPDGQYLAVGQSMLNTTQLIRVSDVNPIFSLVNPPNDPSAIGTSTRQITSLAFSPDGTLLAAASADRSVGLWRISDGSLVQTLWGKSGYSSVAFSPDGQMLAAASFGEDVELWQVSGGRLLRTLRGPYRISAVAFSPDGKSLVSSEKYNGAIFIWEMR